MYSRTRMFSEIFHDPKDPETDKTDYEYFEWFYDRCGVPDRLLEDDKYNLEAIYFILMSYYANDHILSSDENRFKLQLMSLIMQYAPQWQKEMKLQDELLALTDDELQQGTTAIYNHAMHPDTNPSTQTLTELQYIDDQNVTKYKKNGIDTYSQLQPFLDDRVTERFIEVFNKLFQKVLYGTGYDPLYVDDETLVIGG